MVAVIDSRALGAYVLTALRADEWLVPSTCFASSNHTPPSVTSLCFELQAAGAETPAAGAFHRCYRSPAPGAGVLIFIVTHLLLEA